jgi:hypothetical protein
MNRYLSLILIACLVFAITNSCKKASKRDRTVYGQIRYKDSSDKPIANTAFLLQTETSGGYPSKLTHESFPFSTDGGGNFKVVFHASNSANVHITYPGSDINSNFFWSKTADDIKWDVNAGVIYAPAP